MKIEGKVALVTGAAKRLGQALALGVARRGANVVVHYGRSKEEAEDTARQIERMGGKAAALQADLTDPRQIHRLVEQAAQALGPVDILVNSASSFQRTPFGEVTVEQWDRLMQTNLRGPFFLAQAVGVEMKRRGAGKIINLSDATMPYAVADFTLYAISKAGIEALTRGLARALAPEVQVNAILPGAILPASGGEEAGWEAAIQANLLKRRGYPEDVVQAVTFLIEQGDFLTGVFLPVDGGRSLGR